VYIAEGDRAQITYGRGTAMKDGGAPLDVVAHYYKGGTYTIIASLDDNGNSVTVKIVINGKVIGKATATQDYPTASVSVYRDYVTGKWTAAPSRA
jgi:hypothetical protein